jgi:hypothetical protein
MAKRKRDLSREEWEEVHTRLGEARAAILKVVNPLLQTTDVALGDKFLALMHRLDSLRMKCRDVEQDQRENPRIATEEDMAWKTK